MQHSVPGYTDTSLFWNVLDYNVTKAIIPKAMSKQRRDDVTVALADVGSSAKLRVTWEMCDWLRMN